MAKDFVTVDPRLARKLAERASAEMVVLTTNRVAAIARITAPGSMKTKIRVVITPTAGGMGMIISEHPATTFVIHGTKPHVIVARRKKMLKFKVNGKDVFARRVNHPGNQPNNFLLKAMLAARQF
jgi:hypothetical protein